MAEKKEEEKILETKEENIKVDKNNQEENGECLPKDKRPIYIAGGCLASLILFMILFMTIGYNLLSLLLIEDRVLYSIQEVCPSDPFISVMSVSTNGENNYTLAVEDDGLFINQFIPEIGDGFVSKGGKNLVLRHESAEGKLYLYADDRTLPTLIHNESLPSSILEGFSSDGQLFGYTLIRQEDERGVGIVDLVGDELIQINGAVFGAFMPSSKEVIVLEYDDRENVYTSIVSVSIPDGAFNHLTELDDVNIFPRVFPSPDGKGVYYIIEDQLLYYDIRAANENEVFEFGTKEGGLAFFKPNSGSLVIIDPQESENQIELLLLDVKGKQITRIDKDIFFRSYVGEQCPQNRCYYGEPSIVFSPDGKLLAYSVNQPGNLDLYVAGIDGSNRTRIASDATWFSFRFSPDKKHIVYIEAEQIDRGGDLYIADYDGGNAIKLDSDVWSFTFAKNGKQILYFKIDDLDRNDPESELLVTRSNGEKKERLLPSRDGIFTFIQIPK